MAIPDSQNSTLKGFVNLSMFKIFKTDYYKLWFLNKSDLRFYPAGKRIEIIKLSELTAFKTRKTTISSTLLIR